MPLIKTDKILLEQIIYNFYTMPVFIQGQQHNQYIAINRRRFTACS
jgi:hypothetical protein